MKTRFNNAMTFLLILSSVATRAQVSFNVDKGKVQATKDSTSKKPLQKYTLPDGKVITEDKLDSIGKAWGSFNMRRDISKKPPEIFLIPRSAKDDIDLNKMAAEFSKKWVGALAPDFSLKDMENQTVTLSKLKGEVVVLNFWFTECKPCIQEMPELNELTKSFDKSKVRFLALALNKKDLVEGFLKSNPFYYRILTDAKLDTKKFEIYSWPTHIVIDKSGHITFLQIGGNDIRSRLTKAINAAL